MLVEEVAGGLFTGLLPVPTLIQAATLAHRFESEIDFLLPNSVRNIIVCRPFSYELAGMCVGEVS